MTQKTFFGRPRWQVTLGVVFFAQLLTAVGFSIVFPFLPLYVESLGSTTGLSIEMMAGLVIAVQGFTMMIASPLWGAVADRYGRKMMVMRATFGAALTIGLMGLVTSGEQLIFLRGVQGFITGTVAANNALVAAATPRDRVGFAMGTLQVGLLGGVAVGPLIGGILADAYGFAFPFFVTAFALCVSGLMILFGIQEDFAPQQDKKDQPKIGLIEQWQHVLGANGVSMVLMMRFLAGIGRTMIIPIAPLFVVSLLPPDATAQSVLAGSVLAVSSATSTLSGIYLGRLGDRIGHRVVLIWAAAIVVVFYIPQVLVETVWQLLVLQALAGLAMGGIIAAPSALLARYTDPGEEGAVYGMDNSVVAGSRAAAPLIGSTVAIAFGMRGTFAATALLFVVVSLTAYFFLPQDKVLTQVRAAAAAGD